MEEDMKKVFDELTEENRETLILVAKGIEVGQNSVKTE